MRVFNVFSCAAILGCACVSAMAVSIDPAYSTFGTLSGATFGGTGIPNNAVAITTINDNNRSFTLGLTAHQRYSNPAPANDGAGTFWAVSGGDVAHSEPGYAKWNLGYYVGIDPNLSWGSGYSLRLYYDKNTAVDNDVTTYRTISESQSSDNLGYGGSFLGFTWGFPVGSFDPICNRRVQLCVGSSEERDGARSLSHQRERERDWRDADGECSGMAAVLWCCSASL